MAEDRKINPPPRNTEPLKGNFFNRPWASWFEELRAYIARLSASASTSSADLESHIAGVGTDVHGLGTISTHDVGEFDPAGSASTVQANLTTHINLTGSSVHGLGTISTHDEDEYATQIELDTVESSLSSSISTTYANCVHLQATTPGTSQAGHFNISSTGVAGTFDSLLVKIGGVQTVKRSASNKSSIHIGNNGKTDTGFNNIWMGDQTGGYIGAGSTGEENVGIGYQVLPQVEAGSYNIGIGSQPMYSMKSGGANIAMGNLSLGACVSGFSNIAIGHFAGYSILAQDNVIIGTNAFYGCNGSYNTAIGSQVSRPASAVSVSRLLALGYRAGYKSYGDNNVFIGCETGSQDALTNVNNSIFIGTNAGVFETNSDRLIIDNSYRGTQLLQEQNAIIYGEIKTVASTQTMRINANTGIRRTPSSTAYFSLVGDADKAAFQIDDSTLKTVPVAGSLEYDSEFYMTYDNGHGATRHRIDTKEKPCTVISSTYTMDGTERVIVGNSTSAPLTVYLPEATGTHLIYKFKNMGTQTMTLEASSLPTADLIDASASKLIEQYQAYELIDCSTNQWLILSYYNNGVVPVAPDGLLLETGDALLLETGDNLLLEGEGTGPTEMATTLQDTYEEV